MSNDSAIVNVYLGDICNHVVTTKDRVLSIIFLFWRSRVSAREMSIWSFCIRKFWSDKNVEIAVMSWFQYQTRHCLLEVIHRLIV